MLKSIPFYSGVLLVLLLYACGNNNNDKRPRKRSTAPTDTVTHAGTDSVIIPDFNIYIENSASMDGYVATESDFKNSIYGFVTDLKARNLVNNLNLHYINDSICTFRSNAATNDINYFIKNLNPTTFKHNGCERKTSNLPNILKQVIDVKDNAVTVLVSDCIFSRGDGNSTNFLTQQKNQIELDFAYALRSKAFSSVIVKMNSQFNGRYFVESKARTSFNLTNHKVRRPYYILIFGKRQNLMQLMQDIDFKDYNGFENKCYFLTPSSDAPVAKIVMKNKVGDFTIGRPATKLVINSAQAGKDKVFQFSFVANMDFLKVDDALITDTAHYTLSPNYSISKIENIGTSEGASLQGYTHLYTLRTTELKSQQSVNLKLSFQMPGWIEQSSTIDDGDPFHALQQQQTFGLEYLIRGISEAYTDVYGDMTLYNATIQVNRSGTGSGERSSGGGWWILFVVVIVGMAIVIWQKNKH